MNLYEKLANIRDSVEAVQKNKSGYGYKYADEEKILSKITGAMKKNKLTLLPSISPNTLNVSTASHIEKKDKEVILALLKNRSEMNCSQVADLVDRILTKESIVRADMTYTWVNQENPEEKVEVPWIFVGQHEDAAQAMGAGLTYTNRYFLLKFFQVATTDDNPEKYRKSKKEAEDRKSSEEIQTIKEKGEEIVQYASELVKAGIDKTAVKKAIAENNNGSANPMTIETVEAGNTIMSSLKSLNKSEKENN